MRPVRLLALLLIVMVVAASCTGDEEEAEVIPSARPTTSTSLSTDTTTLTTTTTSAAFTTTTTGATTTTVFLSGASLEEGWVAGLGPDQQLGAGGVTIYSATVADFGVVAVGETCEALDENGGPADCSPAAWVSENGEDWTKVFGPDAGLDEGIMFAATAGGTGVVGVGSTCSVMPKAEGCEPAIWSSADGYTWSRAVIPEAEFTRCEMPECQIYAVANADAALVAAGWDGSGLGVWTSADGMEWSKTALDPDEFVPAALTPEIPGEGDIEQLVTFGDSVIAIGTVTLFEYEGDEFIEWWYPTAVWESSDGISWTRLDDGFFGDADTWITDVTIWGDKIYAIGDDCDRDNNTRPVLWSTSDGTDWAARYIEDLLGTFEPARIHGSSDALVIFGSLDNRPVAATTVDGETWTTHDLDDTLFNAISPANDLLQYQDRLIAISGFQINTWQP